MKMGLAETCSFWPKESITKIAHRVLSMIYSTNRGNTGDNIMNVSLGNKWEEYVEEKVKSGDFQTASEVLREGLRLLEEKDFLKRVSVSSLAELKLKLEEGVASLNGGKGIDAEEAFSKIRQRIKGRKARA